MWGSEPCAIQKWIYHHYDEEFNPQTFLDQNKGKEINAIISNVGSDRIIDAYIKELNLCVRIQNAYILTPISRTNPAFQAKDLKLYTQQQILH